MDVPIPFLINDTRKPEFLRKTTFSGYLKKDVLNTHEIEQKIKLEQTQEVKQLSKNTSMIYSIMNSLREYLSQDQEQIETIEQTIETSKEVINNTNDELTSARKHQVTASRIKFVILTTCIGIGVGAPLGCLVGYFAGSMGIGALTGSICGGGAGSSGSLIYSKKKK